KVSGFVAGRPIEKSVAAEFALGRIFANERIADLRFAAEFYRREIKIFAVRSDDYGVFTKLFDAVNAALNLEFGNIAVRPIHGKEIGGAFIFRASPTAAGSV